MFPSKEDLLVNTLSYLLSLSEDISPRSSLGIPHLNILVLSPVASLEVDDLSDFVLSIHYLQRRKGTRKQVLVTQLTQSPSSFSDVKHDKYGFLAVLGKIEDFLPFTEVVGAVLISYEVGVVVPELPIKEHN